MENLANTIKFLNRYVRGKHWWGITSYLCSMSMIGWYLLAYLEWVESKQEKKKILYKNGL